MTITQLVLVARRQDRLHELQTEISARLQVNVECVAMDLADADTPQRLYDQLKKVDRTVNVLVNNTGLGFYGEFWTTTWERLHHMLELDILALTHLTHLLAADVVKQNYGYILLVGSTGSFSNLNNFTSPTARMC
jgi:short-subunit dehydrogenase